MIPNTFPPLVQMIAVVVGGAVGSLARFLAAHFFAQWFGATFPWATLFVNVTGSIWLGLIGALALQKPGAIDPVLRLLLTTGFAGGFTTFSTFASETLMLYERGESTFAMFNVGSNLALGLLGVWLGAIIARLI